MTGHNGAAAAGNKKQIKSIAGQRSFTRTEGRAVGLPDTMRSLAYSFPIIFAFVDALHSYALEFRVQCCTPHQSLSFLLTLSLDSVHKKIVKTQWWPKRIGSGGSSSFQRGSALECVCMLVSLNKYTHMLAQVRPACLRPQSSSWSSWWWSWWATETVPNFNQIGCQHIRKV